MKAHPDLELDLREFYRLDVDRIGTEHDLALYLAAMERLADEPRSRYRASVLGGREHIGWGTAEYLLAALVDAIQANTAVTAVAGSNKRPKVPKPIPRPGVVKPESDTMDLGDSDRLLQLAAMLNG